ncbi:hypothetical protein [Leucobacter sp. G161]|uniref:hypothetical protein n=1 Tax=Leucobacter sp. G161 TaxID=663704 RepID=UPI00073C34FA|nr:hypothetical protein [Leucobacter sp. G161]KUF05550.1 hypothetical protein AUL38_04130 [Leucobacter sp. G161]
MSRSRESAKQAGTAFEGLVAKYLARVLAEDRIERRAKHGSKDRGDVGGVRTVTGDRVVIECKDVRKLNLSGWVDEAEVERGNDDAAVGVVVHKRSGKGEKSMGETYVTMTLANFAVLLGGGLRD